MGAKTTTQAAKPASSSITSQAQSSVFRREVDKLPENPLQQIIWQPSLPGAGATSPPPPNSGHNFANVSVLSPASPHVQPKLTVGEPNDKYEQEADRVADQVMGMTLSPVNPGLAAPRQQPTHVPGLQNKPQAITPWVQLQTDNEDHEETALQTKPLIQRQTEYEDEEEETAVQAKSLIQREAENEDEEDKQTLQASAATLGKAPVVTSDVASGVSAMQGGGQALSRATRAFMEPRFGHDFSKVRIHADSNAANTSRQINARAFTVGQNIAFGSGQYQPNTLSGRKLLVHELTHVVQQGKANFIPSLRRQPNGEKQHPSTVATPLSESSIVERQQKEGDEEEEGGLAQRLARAAIDQALKLAILLVKNLPDRLLVALGPLTLLFKAGAIGFLTRLAAEGGARLLGMLKNAAKAITSPAYIFGYIKGFLRGFFVDGLAGIFIFLLDVGKLAVNLASFGLDVAKAIGGIGLEEIKAIADEIMALGQWVAGNGQALWADFKSKLESSGGIVDVVADVLMVLFGKAKDLASAAGTAVADSLVKFFKQSTEKLGAKLGEFVGGISGYASFEIILAALTLGGGVALTAAKTGVRTILGLLTKVGRGAASILSRMGSWIAQAAKAVGRWAKALGQTKFFKNLGKKISRLFNRIKRFVQKLILKLKLAAGRIAKPDIGKILNDGHKSTSRTRLQHASKHAREINPSLFSKPLKGGFKGAEWSNWKQLIKQVLESPQGNPFVDVVGNDLVVGYIKHINGTPVAAFVYQKGPLAGHLATVTKAFPGQLMLAGL